MKKRTLLSSNNAVVGIVVAVLMIGLIISVVALIQTLYIPKWMEEKEAEHMEEVIDQFTRLKYAIDTQVATNQIGLPIATTITLGSKELPFLLSQRSYGYLEILSYPYSGCKFEITTNSTTYNIYIGTIKYSSANAYYVNQIFNYESGAIITSQTDGYDMTIKPSFSFIDNTQKILILNIVNASTVGGKSNGGGYGSTAIMTEFSEILINNTNPPNNEKITQIKITSNYPNEWKEFMEWLLKKQLYPSYCDILLSGNEVIVDINVDIKLEIKEYNIDTQIGPGWVE
jgi:hypothetical protein